MDDYKMIRLMGDGITLVSSDANGVKGNNASTAPSITADGRYVVFESAATNLIANDNNYGTDIFMKDTQTGVVTCISTTANGTPGNGISTSGSISSDGRYVAFISDANDLVAGDTTFLDDVFVKDLQTGHMAIVSKSASGVFGNASSLNAKISADGQYITFSSNSTNLVANDTNSAVDIFSVTNPFYVASTGGNGATTVTAGNDILIGGSGIDTLSYEAASAAVKVSLAIATLQKTGGSGSDTISGFENLSGSSFNDTLTGDANDNVLSGLAGNDALTGGAGDDTLDGGIGADKLTGGLGDDVYYVDVVGDKVIESAGQGSGTDTIHTTLTIKTINNIENFIADGTLGITLTGNILNNTLTGNSGANILNGGLGNDTMNGGTGNDTFVLNTKLNATTNLDTISDFTSGEDHIQLENAIFKKLITTGALSTTNFASNASGTAQDTNDYILFNTTTHLLSYDADGSAAGVAVGVVVLTGISSISANDFLIS